MGPACTVKVYPGDNLMVHKASTSPSRATWSSSTPSSSLTAVLGDLVSTKARTAASQGSSSTA